MIKKLTCLALVALMVVSCSQKGTKSLLYVGTYGENIHLLNYDSVKGITGVADSIPAHNASYLCLDGNNLYAVCEDGANSGVYSFAQDKEGWKQTAFYNQVGEDPCYITKLGGSNALMTADYTGGSYSMFSLDENGAVSLRTMAQAFPGAHIHQAKELPAAICESVGAFGRFLLISDLGRNLIIVERYIQESNFLMEICSIPCGEGTGPRHMEFNPANNLLYCLCELSGEIIVWKISAPDGSLCFDEVQRLQADGFDAHGSADIHLHPCGKWLYSTHRLQGDGICLFAVDENGLLEKKAYYPCGEHPRNFCFSPDGERLLVACKNSNSIQLFDINQQNGELSEMVQEFKLEQDEPSCLVF